MKTITRLLTILLLTASLLGGASGFATFATKDGLAFAAGVAASAPASPSAPAATVPSPHDEALLALINQARQNPLAVAASMGMDPAKILQDLPELEKILREGLPPVTFNTNLSEAARAHTQEMFANGYYSHDSPDGRGYDARIRNSGYPAATTGESLGMLFFANFVNPGDAVRVIFEYMFWDELDPSRKEKRNILDPGLKEAGVSVDTGVLSLGGALWNVYLATVDFGAVISEPVPPPEPPPVPTPESELLRLINQARANPFVVAASLGIDIAMYLEGRPELRTAFEQGLPPLAINATLSSASQAHVRDMLENNYYGKISPDGRTYKERIEERGYRFAAAGESLGLTWLFADPVDPSLAVGSIFQRMLRDELEPSNAGDLTILDPRMKETGIALREGVFRSGNWDFKVYLAVCDVAMPSPIDPRGF